MAGMAKAEEKIPLKIRFMAWWEGYDADQFYDYVQKRAAGEHPPLPQKNGAETAPKDALDKAIAEKVEEAEAATEEEAPKDNLPFDPWDKARIEIAQYVWGPGYCGPGGPEHIITISKLLALSPELSMADLGAGLGGPMRTLVEQFGVWAMGYEESANKVEAGNQLSKMAGMMKKAPLTQFKLSPEYEFDRRYDRFILRDELHLVEDKRGILTRLEDTLKPEGLILLTDYVLADESVVAADSYKEWRDGEPIRPHMVTQQEYAELISKAGLALRVNEDRTKEQIDLITHAWSGVDELIAKLMADPNSKHLVKVLAKEAELWNRRVKVMQRGRIKYCRFLAAKRARKTSMMSNW